MYSFARPLYAYTAQRNPKYWGADADTFSPDRWLRAPEVHAEMNIALTC